MAKAKNSQNDWTLERVLPWLLLLAGAVALIASIMLATEVFQHYRQPTYAPVCDLNPIFSCTNVAASAQAHIFGFPNYFIGIAGFAAVVSAGVALLAGSKPERWAWRLLNAGLLFAFGFITWLQFQTLYRIGALCLFCIIVWSMTGPLFWYTSLYNLRVGNVPIPKRFKGIVAFAQRHHADILILWFLIIIALILKRFWYYWSTLI
jgi:uncharacterized membrane protein